MSWGFLVAMFLVASTASALGTGLVSPRLHRAGIIDVPNARSSHTQPKPRGGGIVVALVTTATAMLAAWQVGIVVDGAVLLGAAMLLSIVGLMDDVLDLKVPTRLAAQGLSGTVVVLGPIIDSSWSTPQALAIGTTAVVFIVGVTNVFNFMDGIDGIAAGTAAAASVVMVVAGSIAQWDALIAIGVACLASSLGFLTQNWSPARVFLGDSGSLFLGFLLAGTIAVTSFRHPRLGLVLLAPLLPFLVDGLLTLARRAFHGEKLTTAHRSHLYQRLSTHYGHGRIAGVYSAVALSLGASALLTGWESDHLLLVLGTETVILALVHRLAGSLVVDG